ncbi:MAG TPA: N,N-dimethylformamidase beta subunit family domain-containing protein [Acidimicrobiales bacterium]|nr:N,N-dimethylformamidase beta subunit family domain-containing protein [Acidimicrobiales bacterium]
MALVLVAAGAGFGLSQIGRGGPAPAAPTSASRRPAHHARSKPEKDYLGPDGVVSPAIVAENRRAGTTAWEITHQPATGTIEGWASTTYAAAGQSVGLYVTTTAPTFRVFAYRMGYYQGKGARQIWASGPVRGKVQPPCPLTPGVNMVSCDNWHRSLTLRVTKAFVQGDYLLKLVGSGGQQSYVLLTVWDPSSTATYLVVARSLTEEGWNTYGGYSYYEGEGACTLGQTGSYPPCNRARVVSFDRPMATGEGASDFLGDEYPLVRFMEEHGLDAAYVTDITVSEHPSIVLRHKVYLSLGHDETWTTSERQAVQRGVDDGMNVAFMGAAPIVRHARLEASPLGPDREEVDYRTAGEDPTDGTGHTRTVTGNTFATPPVSWPPTSFVGGEYSGYVDTDAAPLAFVVYDASSWIFEGTGLRDGSQVPDVIRSDIQHVNPATSPADLQVLGHSPVPLTSAYTNQGEWDGDTYSDMTYYTDPTSKAGIFESGTVSWISRLTICETPPGSCPARAVARITGNLLRLFGQGPAGRTEPSVANTSGVSPAGS